MQQVSLRQYERFIDLLHCPVCHGDLVVADGALTCRDAQQSGCPTYPITNGIPQLFAPFDWTDSNKKDVTEEVRQFYEETPFPNYDDFDSVAALLQKSRKGQFARWLDEQLPLKTKILEVGCGTGQLSNFLGIAERDVFGADLCLNSLSLAEDFRRRNQLNRVGFYQMNLFRPIFRDETFDMVVSNGVLHHTGDPYGGFRSIAPLVKKGGYIVIGLYNTYGRLMTDLRRAIFRITGPKLMFLDPYLRERGTIDAKTRAWFADQYRHPHESKHTMGEVMKWFDQTGFKTINSVPSYRLRASSEEDDESLFTPVPKPDPITLAIVQAQMIATGNREGGLFIMIGQRQ